MHNKWQLLNTLIQKRHFKKAETHLKRMLGTGISQQEELQALEYRARIRLLTGRPDETLEIIRQIQQLQERLQLPADAKYLELAADACLSRYELARVGFTERSDLLQAQELYHKILQKYPRYENLGWIYYQSGRANLLSSRVAPAERYFHQALLQPSTVQALTAYCYERLGFIAFFESRQPYQASTFLQKAIDTYPTDESSLWLVQVYLLQSRVYRDLSSEKALEVASHAYNLALELDNKALIAETLFTLAEISHHQRNTPHKTIEYLQAYTQLIKTPVGINVTQSRVYEMLADACFEIQDYERAIAAYENVLAFNPDYPWEEHIRYQIACSHYQNQAYQQVIETIQPILPDASHDDRSVDFHNFYSILGNAYFATQQYKQAVEAYDLALKTAPSGKNLEQLEASYQRSRQLEA